MPGPNQGQNLALLDSPANKGQFSAGVSLAGGTTVAQFVPAGGAPATTTATSAAAVPGLLVAVAFLLRSLAISFIPQGNAANQTLTVQIHRTPAGGVVANRVALTAAVVAGILTSGANTSYVTATLPDLGTGAIQINVGDLLECTITAANTLSTQVTNLTVALG